MTNHRLRAVGQAIVGLATTPLGKISVVAVALRLASFAWGLPGSDGWDDDGVAPRDFLVGVLETYRLGHHYTYPPLHLLLLTAVEAPVWIATLLTASQRTPEAVVQTFIAVGPMTAMAVIARGVTLALSIGILWTVARIGEELCGSRRGGYWVAAACAVNQVFTYYSQTTNLDVPYLFWSLVSLRALVSAIVYRDTRALRMVPVWAALGVATKDQAYALFLLGLPLSLGVWLLDPSARGASLLKPIAGNQSPRGAGSGNLAPRGASGPSAGNRLLKEFGYGLAAAVLLLVIVDGALTNPTGFMVRVRGLLGAASQDHANYAKTWSGRANVLRDVLRGVAGCYPWPFVLIAVLGLIVALRRAPDRSRRVASLVPFFWAVSFTITFNITARRTEARFVLPQSIMLGLYAGMALNWLQSRFTRGRGWLFWGLVAPCFAVALFDCAAVDAAMLLDPRYDAERWLHSHVLPGDRIEVYGNNVHLPRLTSFAHVSRVDESAALARNPLPGLMEVSDRFSNVEARRPQFIVVSEFWAERYLLPPEELRQGGHVLTPEQHRLALDLDARSFFRDLRDERLKYRFAHLATYDSQIWPRVDIHASLTRDVWIFERAR